MGVGCLMPGTWLPNRIEIEGTMIKGDEGGILFVYLDTPIKSCFNIIGCACPGEDEDGVCRSKMQVIWTRCWHIVKNRV